MEIEFLKQNFIILITDLTFLGKNSISAVNCYKQLEWFYDTIQKTAIKLSMTSLYWENPKVKEDMNQLYLRQRHRMTR